MSSICADWAAMDASLDKTRSQRQELASCIASLRSAKSYRFVMGREFSPLYRTLDRVISHLDRDKQGIRNLENGLSSVMREYSDAEHDVSDIFEKKKSISTETQKSQEQDSDFWKNLWKIVENIGIVGGISSALGTLLTTKWSASTGITSLKSLVKALGNVAGTAGKGVSADWKSALFGFNDGMEGISGKGFLGLSKSSLQKQFGSDLSFSSADNLGKKIKVGTKWFGHALTFLGNFVDNADEFRGQKGSEGRMISESVIETAVDIGTGALATAGVTALAGMVAAGSVPAFVIGIGATAVVAGANQICKWATMKFTGTEKDIGEVIADGVCDLGERAIKSWKSFAKWGKSLVR